ncbi:hypothetical protein N3K66_002757 [Trichothecium roseum]|uniref:Uncharacterized protein n=1 Tax=Trichothecium roseum TaxID=47278 RepID=A0ACC0VC40_9HYPO|nr:hypothetical protein N3K66_002757 [Trichothecium roseum]
MFTVKQLLAAAALAGLAQAKTHTVTAKSDSFDPDTVKAEKGDTIEFRFEGNHSIVAGDYRYPCSALDVGTSFYSGFNDDKDKVWRITVNSTDPQVFYSSRDNECADGMSGIINPSGTQNLTDYQDRAAEINRAITPSREPYGGELIDADDAEGSDDDSSSGDNDGGKDDKGDDGDDSGKSGDDDSAARLIGVPATVLLAAVGVAVAMA